MKLIFIGRLLKYLIIIPIFAVCGFSTGKREEIIARGISTFIISAPFFSMKKKKKETKCSEK